MKNYYIFLRSCFLFLIVCFTCIGVQKVEGAEEKGKTIRVAYPIQEGLTMVDEDGSYSGYTYEYLMEIAQYTGWNYDFVQIEGGIDEQLSVMMEMLKEGELDLMGGMYLDESTAEIYSYPGYSYGTNYVGIFVPGNSEITETNVYSKTNIRVGVYSKKGEKSAKLEQFAQMNNIDVEQVVTQDNQEYKSMIQDGKVDALLTTDLAMQDDMNLHAVLHFSPMPFYFMATKGRVDITSQLDYALAIIDEVNPDFSMELFNKYFSFKSEGINLTKEEKEFVESSDVFRVVMYNNKPPFQYLDEETGKPAGITVEILNEISKDTGLKFSYVTVSTFKKYQELLVNGKVDISADSIVNYEDAAEVGCTLTLPWGSLPVYMLFKEETTLQENSSYAVPYFLRNIIPKGEHITYYDTVLECLQAVSQGSVKGGYVGEFCSQYYLNTGAFKDLKFINQQEALSQKLCFGIRNMDEYYLLSTMNKAIGHIPSDKKQEIIYRNTFKQQKVSVSIWLENNRGKIALVVLFCILIIFIGYIFVKNRKQRQIAFEIQRHNILNNLMNEFLFEYDIRKDELSLADKCAEFFKCEKMIDKFAYKLEENHKEERTGIWQLGKYITSGKEGREEVSCLMPDKSRKWLRIISANVYEKKNYIYRVGKIQNIQDSKAEKIRLEQKASLDGLTGIYNITTVKSKIKERLEVLDKIDDAALIILDVDSFKQVNDRYGHYNGDAVLIQVADIIRNVFAKDLAGRLGGDEFVIYAEKMSREEIEEGCKQLCHRVEEKIKIILGEAFTISVGVTIAEPGKSYEELYQQADTALYQTKSNSKNGYTFYKG